MMTTLLVLNNDDNDENTAGGRAGEMQRNQLDRQQWAGDNTFSPIDPRKAFSKKYFELL